jgi:simple sugar transport system ATP-binding protein
MRVQGHALIFISHKLGEVQALSDRITVMRGGRTIETVPNQHVEKRTLARMMVGRDVQFAPDRPPNATGAVRLAIHDLHVLNDQRLPALRGVSLEVCGGEIVGIAGVSGNGQRELAESIAGLRPAERGALMLNGVDMLNAPIAARLRAGLAYIPEERMRHGMIGAFSVAENAVLQNHADSPYTRRGLLDFNAISAHAQKLIEQYQIKTPSTRTPVKNLSGGNIQKLILGRELARQPNIVIAAQPTRGVDISATEYIHNVLMGQRGAGVAILLISEDLDEILALSDRIAVIYEGRIVRIFSRAEATPERLGMLMAGAATTRD